MPRVKLVLEYDGTNYVGWQIQPNGPSIQGRVQHALSELLGQPIQVFAAGRTDSGVHARGQVIAFDSPRQLPMKAYWMGLNGILPDDISVIRAEEVRDDFDPRRWSEGKRYRYLVSNRRTRSPLRRLTHWEIYQPLALEPMREASRALIGKHDFAAFRGAECQAVTSIRELKKIEITGTPGDEFSLAFEGTAFLRHMVRNLVGTLIEVARNRQPVEWVAEVLNSKDRGKAGTTAPPQGLCLEEVFYGAGPRDEKHDDDE